MKFKDWILLGEKQSGVITAQNPQSHTIPPHDNKSRNERLVRDLEAGGFKFKKVDGSYKGNKEDSFEIDNIDLPTLKKLGRKHDQESVAFGGLLKKVDPK
jgi:hypothetical protein